MTRNLTLKLTFEQLVARTKYTVGKIKFKTQAILKTKPTKENDLEVHQLTLELEELI